MTIKIFATTSRFNGLTGFGQTGGNRADCGQALISRRQSFLAHRAAVMLSEEPPRVHRAIRLPSPYTQ